MFKSQPSEISHCECTFAAFSRHKIVEHRRRSERVSSSLRKIGEFYYVPSILLGVPVALTLDLKTRHITCCLFVG